MKSNDAFISCITRASLALLCDLIDLATHGEFWTFHLLGCFFMFFSIEPAIFFAKAILDEKKEAIHAQEQAKKKSQQKPKD